MKDRLEDLKETEEKIKRLNNLFEQMKGKKAQIKAELEKKGFGSIKEAHDWIKKTGVELGEKSSQIKKLQSRLNKKVTELENGLLLTKTD